MAWDEEYGPGRVKRTIRSMSGEGTVFLYRIVVGLMTTVCAGLSGLIFGGFIDQGKQLSAILAMQPRTEQRLSNIESTIGQHTTQINGAASQERMDIVIVQGQIAEILKKLDDQNEKLTNLGVAVARVRGAQKP